jgi:hypothetical protein
MGINLLQIKVGGKTYSDLNAGLTALEHQYEGIGQEITEVLRLETLDFLHRVFQRMLQLHGSPWNQQVPTGADHLFKRREAGGLRDMLRSIKAVGTAPGEVAYSISATGTFAVHEEGAEINAKPGKWLLIPLRAAYNYKGIRLRKSSFGYKNTEFKKSSSTPGDATFVQKTRRGNLVIFQRRAGGKLVPLYLLKKKVILPPRLQFRRTFDSLLPEFERRTLELIEEELEKRL